MEGENQPLLSSGNTSSSEEYWNNGTSTNAKVGKKTVNFGSQAQRMSFPGELGESQDSDVHRRIEEEETLVNLSMRHVVKRNKRAEHATTDLQTFVHLVKANLGSGLLALPFAMSTVGYIVGPVMLTTLGIMSIHCIALLIKSCQVLCKRYDVNSLDYGEVAEAAFWQFTIRKKIGSYVITEFTVGKIAKLVVNIFLVITQLGFCCVYFVFMSENLQQVFDASGVPLDKRVWIAVLLPLVILFSWIKNLDTLVPFSLVANLCIFFGLGAILYYIFYLFVEKTAKVFESGEVVAASIGGTVLPVFFGNALYSYEGIGMMLPLENKMKKPKHFIRVLYTAMGLVTMIYVSIGVLGYLAFGEEIEESITLNLPKDKRAHSVVFHIVKLYFCFAIFVTYALVFYVPMDFIEPPLFRALKIDKRKWSKQIIQLVFRTIIVIITAGFAVAIPKLDLFIALIGACASSALAIIFPPILQILVFYSIPEPWWQKTLWISKCILICSVGVIGFFTGTYTSLQNIIDYFKG